MPRFRFNLLCVFIVITVVSVQSRVFSSTISFEDDVPGLGRSVEIELIELEPPVDTWRGKFLPPATEENVPWWVKSVFWALRLQEKDLPRVYTRNVLSNVGELGPPPLGLEPPDLYTRTTHAIRIKTNGVEYFFTGTLYADRREKLGDWAQGLSTISNAEGTWKIDDAPNWISRFPFNSREKMKELISSRRARLNEQNELVPVK